jgi:hypothetical protein
MKQLYILQNIEQIKFWNIIGKIISWTLNTIKKKMNLPIVVEELHNSTGRY